MTLKTNTVKKYFFFLLIVVAATGCRKLTDVIDREPPNNLVPENVAKTAEGARNLLNGAYAMLHDQYYYMFTEHIPGVLSGAMRKNGFLVNQQFQDNAVLPENGDVNNYWIAFYKMTNQSNWVITLVNELPDSELSQTEREAMIGQARGLRAMAHFDALRYFGQFYDLNSPYGVVIRTDPSDFTTRTIKRSTVAEVYTQVLSDLDYAISHAPEFTKTTLFSKTAGKALKARVLLFKGDYTVAAALADEVIAGGNRELSTTFAKVFSDGFNSKEMIFMRATDDVTYTKDRKHFTYGSRHAIASPWFKTLMAGDPRIAATYDAANSSILKVFQEDLYAPTYFMRLAEMYLVKSEGLVRSGAPLEEAKAPLGAIMSRAYGVDTTSAASTQEELLDDIYKETIKELSFENGSEWFANIRFNKIMAVKPTVKSVDQYILPIPEAEVMANAQFGPQNPGY
jgi:starch-binding outer membrane protein, SusD/RagB family